MMSFALRRKINYLKIFNEFNFTQEIIIYTRGSGGENTHLYLSAEHIKLIADIDINLSIIHYN